MADLVIDEVKIKDKLRTRFDVCVAVSALLVAIWVFIPSADAYRYVKNVALGGVGLAVLYIILYAFTLIGFYLFSKRWFKFMRGLFALAILYLFIFLTALVISRILHAADINADLVWITSPIPFAGGVIYVFVENPILMVEYRVGRAEKKANRLAQKVNIWSEKADALDEIAAKAVSSNKKLAMLRLKISLSLGKRIAKKMTRRLNKQSEKLESIKGFLGRLKKMSIEDLL